MPRSSWRGLKVRRPLDRKLWPVVLCISNNFDQLIFIDSFNFTAKHCKSFCSSIDMVDYRALQADKVGRGRWEKPFQIRGVAPGDLNGSHARLGCSTRDSVARQVEQHQN